MRFKNTHGYRKWKEDILIPYRNLHDKYVVIKTTWPREVFLRQWTVTKQPYEPFLLSCGSLVRRLYLPAAGQRRCHTTQLPTRLDGSYLLACEMYSSFGVSFPCPESFVRTKLINVLTWQLIFCLNDFCLFKIYKLFNLFAYSMEDVKGRLIE